MRTGMSNTMVRRFCTLEEAAEQLDATQEQVESLLKKAFSASSATDHAGC